MVGGPVAARPRLEGLLGALWSGRVRGRQNKTGQGSAGRAGRGGEPEAVLS